MPLVLFPLQAVRRWHFCFFFEFVSSRHAFRWQSPKECACFCLRAVCRWLFFVVERALPLAAVVALLFQGRSATAKLCLSCLFVLAAESGLHLAYIQSESGLSLANVMSEGGLAPANLLIESGLALSNVLFQSGSSLATVCLLFRW